MDDKEWRRDLEKRVRDVRASLRDDYLGATFMELFLRLQAEELEWVTDCTFAFFTELYNTNKDASLAFVLGITAAMERLSEEMENG